MNEPAYTPPDTFPVAANSGTLGTAASGAIHPGVTAGVAGPPCKGMGADNVAANFDGATGYIDCGSAEGLNISSNITVMAWIRIKGWSHMFEAVVAKGWAGYRLNKYFTRSYFVNNEMAFSTTGVDLVGTRVVHDGYWHHVVGVYDGTTKSLYIDGTLDSTAAQPGSLAATTSPLWIGNSIDWIASGSGSYMECLFDGAIDEVAVIPSALTAEHVLQVFNAAQEPPVITQQPQALSGPVDAGNNVSFQGAAIGGLPLTCQWVKNDQPMPGQTTTTLTLSQVTPNDSGNYALVFRNDYGSTTSSIVTLNVQVTQPSITQQPQPMTRFAGGTAVFSVKAAGTQPLAYQWSNNHGVIAGATNSSFAISSVTPADALTYTVRVSNPYGAMTSTAVDLTVLSPGNTYAAVVMGGGPVAYWRLGEAGGTIAHDYVGGYDGAISAGVVVGSAGPQPPDFTGMESSNTSMQFNGSSGYVQATSSPALNPYAFTVSAWIRVNNFDPTRMYDAIVTKGDSSWRLHRGHLGNSIAFGVNGATSVNLVGTKNVNDGLWHYVVGVVTGSAVQLFIDGDLHVSTPQTGTLATNNFPIRIGENAEQTGRVWDGNIDEVALYNRALSPIEIKNLYSTATTGPVKPWFYAQPMSQGVIEGSRVVLSATAVGGMPMTYQWKKNNVNIPGATASSYLIPSAYYTDVGSYSVGVTNELGGILSAPATLTVVPEPQFASLTDALMAHYKFDGSCSDASGRNNNGTAVGAISYVGGKIGANALHYSTTDASGNYNYVTLGNPTDLSFGPGQDFSVAFWTRFTGTPGDLPFLANSPTSYGDVGVILAPSKAQGGWSWYINDAAAASGQGIGLYDPVKATLNNGQWHNLVFTFGRASVATVYLDGVAVSQTSIQEGKDWNLDTGYGWDIGQSANGNYPADGAFDMDDLGIWAKALTQAEAQSIYIVGQGAGKSFDVTGPINIKCHATSGGVEIIWQTGTLMWADEVAAAAGLWKPVTGAVAPYYKAPIDSVKKFYKVK
jgi:hypothetical protein